MLRKRVNEWIFENIISMCKIQWFIHVFPREFISVASCHVERQNSQFSILFFHTDSSSSCSWSLLASHWVITMATDVRKTYRIFTTKPDQMHFIIYKIIWEEPVLKMLQSQKRNTLVYFPNACSCKCVPGDSSEHIRVVQNPMRTPLNSNSMSTLFF